MPRANNGSVENRRLAWIVEKWNAHLKAADANFIAMLSNIGIVATTVEKFIVAGGASKHFDISILYKDGSVKNIEHKGLTGKVQNDEERPWSLTPQLLNAPYNFSQISLGYCSAWYNCMTVLKSYWPTLLPEIPEYNDWLKKDATVGKPKSEWGIALKAIRGFDEFNAAIIDEIYYLSIKQYWKLIKKNQKMLKKFKKDLTSSIQHVLSQKHFWLNAFYETSDTIETNNVFLTITPQISNLSVHIHLNEDTNKLPKIELQYNLTSNPNKKFKGQALMRWGNGNGIANIRWNIS